MRIGFVQNGDFRKAHTTIQTTGQESYHAQKHSMALVEWLAQRHPHVCVICLECDVPYRDTLPNGVHTEGVPLYHDGRKQLAKVTACIERQNLTHVILRHPDVELLRACLRMGLSVLPIYADTLLAPSGLRQPIQIWRNWQLAQQLNAPAISYIGNHNIAASESLARIGVARDKIIPWDWPRAHFPEDHAAKTFPADRPLRLIVVGKISTLKGVTHILRALSDPALSENQITFLGAGDITAMEALRDELGLGSRCRFLGPVPFAEVMPQMLAHDALIAFSLPQYQEGMPGVVYQGLAARLPLILSPHAAFKKFFTHAEDVLFAKSFQPQALARTIAELQANPALYDRLSQNSGPTFRKLVLDTDWVELVSRWLAGSAEDHAWLAARRLDAVLARNEDTAPHGRAAERISPI